MLKRIQKRAERKEREVAPLKSKKLVEAESGSEQDDESGSEAGSDEVDESEEDDDRDELNSMSGEEDSSDEEDDDEDEDEEDDEDEEEEEDADEDAPPVSLDDAISHPIYSLTTTASDDEDEDEEEGSVKADADKDTEKGPKRKLQACILCPQRLFKNDKMVEDHVKSKSHIRSRVRFAQRLLDPDSLTSDDPRDIVLDILEDLEAKKAGKKAVEEEKSKVDKDEKKANEGKKRKWKEETKVAKEARREAKRSKPEPATPAPAETEDATLKSNSKPAPAGGMNREARRIEQLLDSLGKDKRAELEPTLKGKKGKDKIKMILEEKKRAEDGVTPVAKQDGGSNEKEKESGKGKSKGKAEKAKRGTK